MPIPIRACAYSSPVSNTADVPPTRDASDRLNPSFRACTSRVRWSEMLPYISAMEPEPNAPAAT